MYLLDQSESIPRTQRSEMLEYVISNVRKHRESQEDRGNHRLWSRRLIEIPPYDDDIPQLRRVESMH